MADETPTVDATPTPDEAHRVDRVVGTEHLAREVQYAGPGAASGGGGLP